MGAPIEIRAAAGRGLPESAHETGLSLNFMALFPGERILKRIL
jgi:hypothetical protein